jgi:hypothetical protein
VEKREAKEHETNGSTRERKRKKPGWGRNQISTGSTDGKSLERRKVGY